MQTHKSTYQPRPVELTLRTRAFSGGRVERVRVRVGTDGTVSVWDDVAGYYTVCHSLTRQTQGYIRAQARATLAR